MDDNGYFLFSGSFFHAVGVPDYKDASLFAAIGATLLHICVQSAAEMLAADSEFSTCQKNRM